MANKYAAALAAFLGNNPNGTAAEFAAHLDAQAAAVSATPKRPKAGTLTGQVWDIADELAKAGPVSRKQVIEVGTKAGLNLATITTQYQAWRQAQAAATKAANEQAAAAANTVGGGV